MCPGFGDAYNLQAARNDLKMKFMQNASRHCSACKLETAGNRSLFLSLANRGCCCSLQRGLCGSSDSGKAEGTSGLWQHEGALRDTMITWREITGRRQVLQWHLMSLGS